MENKKTSPILYVITTLLVINLVGTLWMINKASEQPSKLISNSNSQENLPDYLTKEIRNEIYKKYEAAYNSRDYDVMWNVFCDYAKSNLNENQFNKTYDNMLEIFPGIHNGVFTYYEFKGKQGNLKRICSSL